MQLVINPSLDNISKALELIDNPQDSFKSIQVAGTNGKGSVCAFLSLLFDCSYEHQEQKILKVGKYISPHLLSVCERFSINGENITQVNFDNLWQELFESKSAVLSDANLGFSLTYFEKTTVIAFEYFKRQNVDIAVLEVGLGGRWDATNVIKPAHTLATLVTNIAMDHMNYLGDTLEQIRAEKEAIIKAGVAHFDGEQILLNLDVQKLMDSNEFHLAETTMKNFLVARYVFESIFRQKVSQEQCLKVLQRFPLQHRGRFNFDANKYILIDGAHNPAAALELAAYISELNEHYRFRRKIFVLGFLDKNYMEFIQNLAESCLNAGDMLLFTNVVSERSSNAYKILEELRELAIDANMSETLANFVSLKAFGSLEEVLNFTETEKASDDLMLISGSLYLIAEYLKLKQQ